MSSVVAWATNILEQRLLFALLMFLIAYKLSKRIFFLDKQFADLPGPPPKSWATGNLFQIFNAKGLPFLQSLEDNYGGVVRIHGFFGDEQLYISDPRAIQSIMLKDQDSYEETAVFTETNKVIFGPGLVATTGEQHKRQRRVVNPIFAVPHLKKLTPVFYEIADKLADVLQKEISAAGSARKLDMYEWMCRVALESVGRTVLGYSFDPLDSPHNNPYTSAIKDLIPTLFSLSLVRQFAPFLVKLGPPWFRRKLVEWTPHKSVQKVMNMSDVMHEKATEILGQKRAQAIDSTEDDEKDIISILLRQNEKAKRSGGEQLSDIELTGQMTVLVFGAQDTTSSCLSRVLHLLAENQDVQDKIRSEIRATAEFESGARMDYDALIKLPWLDAVLKETLRLYPPVPFVRRSAVKETVLPFLKTGTAETGSVRVPKDTILFVSVAGANRLESVWGADAKEWKPERWFAGDSFTSDPALRLPGVFSGMRWQVLCRVQVCLAGNEDLARHSSIAV
ncbi:hypothetical protein D9613_001355 [Agrocybe pediades]|uniref:Cytochrome P450 n=1 Tax=Agrocybe pediades TaxID=84607 RepID=A0A8H4R665_9AGAR|nr:hypothetical protein D9613_001355 [Agrocybe pediades]